MLNNGKTTLWFQKHSTAALLAVLLLLIGSSAFAAEYFLSPSGDDANPGTEARPFQTLERARDAVRNNPDKGREPITVWLKEGRYFRNQTFVLNKLDSGT